MRTIKRYGELVDSLQAVCNRICICIPLTGVVRAEWMLARYNQLIPVNWSNIDMIQWVDTFSPLHYNVEDARNISVDFAVRGNFEWLLFIDHDVVIPPDTFVKLNAYMQKKTIPVVSGIYNCKGNPPEPLIFRGRGNSYYKDWKYGDKVWVDGIPMGIALLSMKLLKPMWEKSEEYNAMGKRVRRVFHTPRDTFYLKEGKKTSRVTLSGTEDLWWCNRVLREKWLEKTGFKAVAKKKYPFLIDTSIKCGHIDETGRIY